MNRAILDIYYVFITELKVVFKDPAVILLFIVVPFLYPLLYGYIYNNEVVRECRLVVVDDSHSSLGREFIRKMDATADVKVVATVPNMDEAQEMMRRKDAYGILYIPSDFSKKINRVEQTQVVLYADMSSLLFYKAFMMAATDVSLDMGADIRVESTGHGTAEEDAATMQAIEHEWVSFYNTQNGFASFLVPAILILIIHQTMLLGIATLVGTHNDQKRFRIASMRHDGKSINPFNLTVGKALCYFLVYLFVSTWVLRIVPYLFKLPQIGDPVTIFMFMIPFLLSATFFTMTLSYFASQREFGMLLFVFSSPLLVFISGISWPWSAIPPALQAIAYIFPTTPGIHAFVRINTMGATIYDVGFEYTVLWIQTVVYWITASLMYRWWIVNYDPKSTGSGIKVISKDS